MRGKYQWRAEVRINAPSTDIWNVANDISRIPDFHPEVDSVDLINGQRERSLGSRYRCNIAHGKRRGSCVEEIVDIVPGTRISTLMGEDSWGLDKMVRNFVVDTTLIPHGDNKTTLRFEGYYDPVGFFSQLLNVVALRRMTKKRSLDVMNGIKRLAENRDPAPEPRVTHA